MNGVTGIPMRALGTGVIVFSLLSDAWSAPAQGPAAVNPPARNAGCPAATLTELELDHVRDGVLYVPKGYQEGRAVPLLVWLHGAGGSGNVPANLAALADEFGFIVLAPDSREWTWGAILGNWGPDLEVLQRAMETTHARCAVDGERIWLGGFSDGASFSLSLGISYGDVFRRVYAGSPGVMQPIAANGKPPIFISHGTSDATMPIDDTSRKFVPRLKALGYNVTYREYAGRHQLPPEILREVIQWLAGSDK
jgi:phospholipase/carboxylesterase